MVVLYKEQRVGVFIDIQNMYYSARNLYNSRVNFDRILKTAIDNRTLVRAIAYVIEAKEITEQKTFFTALKKIGFEVKMKQLQTFIGGHKKGDWDIGIAMDMVRMAPKLDVAVLVSGDGDFSDLVEYMKANGCRVEVIAFGKTGSIKLKTAADKFTDLDESHSKYLIKGTRTSSTTRNPTAITTKK